jgi:hypothetical protein
MRQEQAKFSAHLTLTGVPVKICLETWRQLSEGTMQEAEGHGSLLPLPSSISNRAITAAVPCSKASENYLVSGGG